MLGDFLLVAEGKAILQVDVTSGAVNVVINTGSSLPVALDYDPVHQHIYWSDVQHKFIHRVNLDGSNSQSLIHTGAST